MQPIANRSPCEPPLLAVRLSIVLEPHRRFPFKLNDPPEVDAMLAQIAKPLRLVPFEVHIGTIRM
jgi:hypothetical protein